MLAALAIFALLWFFVFKGLGDSAVDARPGRQPDV